MAEYIERENLIMDIQSRNLAEIVPNCNEPEIAEATYKQGQAIKKIITEYPAADVVKVVRCKDCKYQDDCARQMVHTTRDYVLEQNISTYNKVDFCSYGEKMSEEE